MVILLLLSGPALAAPEYPKLTGRVVDEAGIVGASTERELDQLLAALEAKTGAQLVVATVESLGGLSIEEYGVGLGRHWAIGREGADDGAILIVAPNDREVRIEVGYGLEGILTDAASRIVIENLILPEFRSDRMEEGIQAGTVALAQILGGELDPQTLAGTDEEEGGIEAVIFILILVVIIVVAMRGRGRRGPPFTGGRGPSSRGGSGGRRGGGFSGRGGSFGGGGSSGKW